MRKKELEAFITIEYTLMLPILILLYAFLIYIGLFMYNRCILQVNTYLLSNQSTEAMGRDAVEKVEKITKQKVLCCDDVVYEIHMRQNGCYISGGIRMQNPLGKMGIGTEYLELSAYSEAVRRSPVNILRLCKAAKMVYEEMKEEKEADESMSGVYQR